MPAGSAIFLVGNPLVDTAPNLSLPLRNTDAGVEGLGAELAATEPFKARFLELRAGAADGVPYELHTVRHFEPNRTLEEYARRGVRYFVIGEDHFGAARLARDTKHAGEVLESRAELAASCRADPRVERLLEIDPERDRLTGPAIEIFHLREPGQG